VRRRHIAGLAHVRPRDCVCRYGFNPGSVLVIDSAVSGEVAARAAVTTTLSGAAGGLTCLANAWRRNKVCGWVGGWAVWVGLELGAGMGVGVGVGVGV